MRWIVLVVCMGLALQVQAAGCSLVATVAASFGSVTSNLVRTTQQQTSTQTAGLKCTPTSLSVLGSGDHIDLTVTSATAGMVGPSGDVIAYSLYANGTTNFPITRGIAFDYGSNSTLTQLVGVSTGGPPTGAPMYMRSIIGSNVAAGVYTETLTLTWNWNYCASVLVLGVCLPSREVGTAVSTFAVNLTVTNDCTITAPSISFGSAPVISGFGIISQVVNLACTKGSTYTVGFSDGGYFSGGRRRMASTSSNYLAYDIFKGSGTVRWGSVAGDRRDSSTADTLPGAGLGITSQNYNYNARIYTDQATPPAELYQDTVTLDVQF